MAKGAFPESHPLCYGPPGMHGSKWANWGLNKADLIVAVGARFDDRVTGKLSAFAPGAKVVHLDIDAGRDREAPPRRHPGRRAAQARRRRPHRGAARPTGPAARRPRRLAPPARRVARGVPLPVRRRRASTSSRRRSSRRLRDLTAGRDDVVWTTGVGQHQMWAMQYLVCDRPRTFITSGGLGTMGYGLPAAIGAKAARPDATVVCIDGDGCFQMTSPGAGDLGARGPADRRRHRQQRLARAWCASGRRCSTRSASPRPT